MPPVVALALGLMGTIFVVRWCVREVRRVNTVLNVVRRQPAPAPIDRNVLPTLKRDPVTGEYRPG
jgi:hypothetical protein